LVPNGAFFKVDITGFEGFTGFEGLLCCWGL